MRGIGESPVSCLAGRPAQSSCSRGHSRRRGWCGRLGQEHSCRAAATALRGGCSATQAAAPRRQAADFWIVATDGIVPKGDDNPSRHPEQERTWRPSVYAVESAASNGAARHSFIPIIRVWSPPPDWKPDRELASERRATAGRTRRAMRTRSRSPPCSALPTRRSSAPGER